MSNPLMSSSSNRSAWLLRLGRYLLVEIARHKDRILCRAVPLSHPDAGSLKVLEHKMPRICGEQGSRDVVLKHNPTHLALEVVSTGSATELPLAYGRPSHRKPRPPISSTGPSMKKSSASIGKITLTSRPG